MDLRVHERRDRAQQTPPVTGRHTLVQLLIGMLRAKEPVAIVSKLLNLSHVLILDF